MQTHIEKLTEHLVMIGLYENIRFSHLINGDDGENAPAMNDALIEAIEESGRVQILIMNCLLTIRRSREFQDFINRLETRTPQLTQTAAEKSPIQLNSMFSAPKEDALRGEDSNGLLISAIRDWFSNDDDMHPHNFNVTGLLDGDSFEKSPKGWTPGC